MDLNLEEGLMAMDLFDSLGREKEQSFRPIELRKNPILEEMMDGFWRSLRDPIWNIPEGYKICIKNIPEKYNAAHIENFSLLLDNQKCVTATGLYLSALINYCPDDIITVHTRHLENLSHLGYRLGCGKDYKTVKCEGNGGFDLGRKMICGSIIVQGDTNYALGYEMDGGIIEVFGDAGEQVGSSMRGGDLYLHIGFKSLARYIYGGNIYQKGKLIVKNGWRIG